MNNPFVIEGPAVISFSGGRTSGLMLRRILDAHDNRLPSDVHVLFANTGKEREETLEFVRDCEKQWGVTIHWIERPDGGGVVEKNFATASRDGKPFDALINQRSYLPNPVTRFCTQELKIRVMRDWMRGHGYETWVNVVGMRADEPNRVAKGKAREGRDDWTLAYPLHAAGIRVADVAAYWRSSPFDLRLQPWEGNCDVCFLKGFAKRVRIIEDRPDLAAWWIAAEDRVGANFRNHEPSYARIVEWTKNQRRLPIAEVDVSDESVDCGCTD